MRFHNTLTRTKQDFVPIDPKRVRLYVCGPTVYDFAHIGNARPVIVFDLLFRLLRHQFGSEHVLYVRNITDVDDKINARAARDYPDLPLNEAIRRLTETTNAQFQADVAALGCLEPTVQPRATEHIAEMQAIVQRLLDRGFAYEAEGHVLFDVPAKPAALTLAGRSDEETRARVEPAPFKRHPADFVLWKPSDAGQPGWDSPWGYGRPGWHIECSAMAWKHLGETFDLHGGGIDLIFPHHENEIAQSCCAFGHDRMARFWLHNGFVTVEGEKMAKSTGNFVTIRDLLADWPGEVLRLNMLRTHYRQPLDWTVRGLEESARILADWHKLADGTEPGHAPPAVLQALADDLNTPMAITYLHVLAGRGEAPTLRAAAGLLGLLEHKARVESKIDVALVERLLAERQAARQARNFAEADRLRDLLSGMGVIVKDGKDPGTGGQTTVWETR